ncbi:hypothetical protein CYMTET_45897, partial [Cymbomonas tetramitiformis]
MRREPRSEPCAGEQQNKRKKKRCALWVGYIGSGYMGSQIQRMHDGETIEGVLEKAILDSGGMLESNFGNLQRVQWGRSSRTDKGVSSLALICSLRLLVDKVRLWHVILTTGSWQSPVMCAMADRFEAEAGGVRNWQTGSRQEAGGVLNGRQVQGRGRVACAMADKFEAEAGGVQWQTDVFEAEAGGVRNGRQVRGRGRWRAQWQT